MHEVHTHRYEQLRSFCIHFATFSDWATSLLCLSTPDLRRPKMTRLDVQAAPAYFIAHAGRG
eukprot:1961279-Pleurochrysis_carterae.AAC.1